MKFGQFAGRAYSTLPDPLAGIKGTILYMLCSELIFFSLSVTLYYLPLMLVNKVDQKKGRVQGEDRRKGEGRGESEGKRGQGRGEEGNGGEEKGVEGTPICIFKFSIE